MVMEQQQIHRMNNQFDFSKLTISQPSAMQGGAYFTKIKYKDEPLFIQSSKCKTRQGVVETNKKNYIDLMYTHDDDIIIEWFENLEVTIQKLIFDKKDIWFQNELELSDIENAFTTTTRAFKGGKNHLVRINMAKQKSFSTQYTCNVYDDNENIITPTDIKPENDIITIFEVQGVKFTSRNFQVELNSKQIMVINEEPLFNECIIRKNSTTALPVTKGYIQPGILHEVSKHINNSIEEHVEKHVEEPAEEHVEEHVEEPMKYNDLTNINMDSINATSQENTGAIFTSNKETIDTITTLDSPNTHDYLGDLRKIEELSNKTTHQIDEVEIKSTDSLEDVTMNLNITDNKNLQLKTRNDVYYEIYKEAKSKANQAKKAAIKAYLDAKKIKNTYLMDEIEDDSDDEDSNNDDMNDYSSDVEDLKKEIIEISEELM